MLKIFLLPLSLVVFTSFSQERAVTSGGDANGSGGSVAYSIGLVDFANFDQNGTQINGGVQQPIEVFTLDLSGNITDFTRINVFPNPVVSEVKVTITQVETDYWTGQLLDASGKIIWEGILQDEVTSISLAHLAVGEYVLRLDANNQFQQSFKLIKH